MWLFRLLFPGLSSRTPLPEQLAYAFGLGMMVVAVLTLGVKLCGFHGYYLVFAIASVGGIAEIWRDGKSFLSGIIDGSRKLVRSPVIIAIGTAGVLVFLILFRLAGLEGIVDGDAAMAWLLKAKMLHLYTGTELVRWFSNPCFANSHLDYPTLVPSLHAATYDSLGHVDEFVTKFWPTWMLFFLLLALASLNRAANRWRYISFLALLGLLLLPDSQKYAQMEGGTMPMVFFTTLGLVQCGLGLMGKDRARLGLGLTLLFGAAMTKFEGSIFLVLIGGSLLLFPAARLTLKPSAPSWRVAVFCILAALPFFGLRFQISSVNYESNWAGHVLSHPGAILSALADWARLFLVLLTQLFLNLGFANWSGEGGQLHWLGRWDGFPSLYNHTTLGLAWWCLLLTVFLWFAAPGRRRVVIWVLAMFIGAAGALTGVFACFVNFTSLDTVIHDYANEFGGSRYLFPMLFAWFATILTLLFADLQSARPINGTNSSALAGIASWNLPTLKGGQWLGVGALLIVLLGVFALPEAERAAPEQPAQNTTTANLSNNSEANSPEYSELQTRMEFASQLEMDGKYAEAIQVYREILQLPKPTYPQQPRSQLHLIHIIHIAAFSCCCQISDRGLLARNTRNEKPRPFSNGSTVAATSSTG
jgi:hypothetical protein